MIKSCVKRLVIQLVTMLIATSLYHFAGGVVMSFKGVDLTLGASFTGGAQRFARPLDFPDGDDNPIFSSDKTASLSWTI
jgi:hypothetical protein